MTLTPLLIADTRIGIQRDIEPWLLPTNDAYPELEDCYIWRGRIKKKQGYIQLGRLRRKIGTTDAGGNIVGTPITLPNNPLSLGVSSFIIGTDFFQDSQISAGDPITLLTNGAAATKSLNRTTGSLDIKGSIPLTDVFYVPGLPVMGLRSLELTTLNQTLLMAFDTRFSYLFNTSSQSFTDASNYRGSTTVFTWSGTDSQFFWTSNYAGALWATNSVAGFQGNSTATTAASGDGIKWFDQDQSGWINFLPPVTGATVGGTGTSYLQGALIILPYKNRLVVLNTTEGADFAHPKRFPQRARWSQNGTPFNKFDQSGGNPPTPTNWNGGSDANNQAWSSDVTGKGGFIDAPTLEQIVSAEFVKDTLIVFFERSTWNLRYTGNELLPFIWEKINTEFGATSTFSNIPFDKIVIGVGDVGIQACDSVNVERIDQKIPDEVFGFQNENKGRQRIYGIRDFFTQLVYWTVPYVGTDFTGGIDDESGELPPPGVSLTFPNKILVYNYIDSSFSFFNDSFTCFGYYQKAADTLWQDVQTSWESTLFNWVTPENQQQFPFIVAGNQLGFVEIFDAKRVLNDDSLFITNISGAGLNTITCVNHNLTVGSFIKITNASGISGLAGNIYKVLSVVDANTFTINASATGTFTGNGTITTVSNINIITKRFNPFIGEAAQVRLAKVDFYFETTDNGQLQVNLYLDEDSSIPVNMPLSGTTNLINTFPESTYSNSPDVSPFVQDKIWKRMNFQFVGQLFQLQITMDDTQMLTENIIESDIVLHGLLLYFEKAGRLINV